MIRVRLKGGAIIVVPLPEVATASLRPLLAGRKPNDLLVQRADGNSFDRWRHMKAVSRKNYHI
ncbi:hypothetical protein [Nonomuraea sp. NPDC050783]|uniref:hypothetical protein n=1 Tax=Nonomuraea sp. NPDC050783 TaxID=3154634 RepID=UPI003467449A